MRALRFVTSCVERYERLPDHKVNWGGLEEIIPTISRALNGCEVGKGGGEGKRCAMTHIRAAKESFLCGYLVCTKHFCK